jgi:hypothetical protein
MPCAEKQAACRSMEQRNWTAWRLPVHGMEKCRRRDRAGAKECPGAAPAYRFVPAIKIITLNEDTRLLKVIIDVISFGIMIGVKMLETLTSGCEGFMADTYKAFNIVAPSKNMAVQGENKHQLIVSADIRLAFADLLFRRLRGLLIYVPV